MSEEAEGFFQRWSRRKQEVAAAEPVPLPPLTGEGRGGGTAALAEAASPHPDLPSKGEGERPEVSPLTLADTETLTIDSDFKPFIANNVAPEVKNAAFKKLFADPRFNVMDGLDTYVEDYSKPSPLPASVLRQMASAKFLKLFDEEPEKPPGADALPDVAQSDTTTDRDIPSQPVADAQPASRTTDDDHADLRLQPDDAARAEDARRGTG